MVDYYTTIVDTLTDILPTYYEPTITNDVQLPCITYIQRNDYNVANGDTLGYSLISYTIKIWDQSISNIMNYAIEVDEALRNLGFKRISSADLYDVNSTIKQKVLVYEALFNETY